MLHPVPRRVLGVSADDALPYNYGEVFSKEGIHAGVLREVECRPSMAILPVYSRPGRAVQEEPHEIYPSFYIPVVDDKRCVMKWCPSPIITKARVCAAIQQFIFTRLQDVVSVVSRKRGVIIPRRNVSVVL